MINNWAQSDLMFCKMNGLKDLRSMKKGVNWVENQGENLYKMLKNSSITHFDETLDQL